MGMKSELDYIQIQPGVNPSTDNTALITKNYVYSDKIRFHNGQPEKIGGNASINFGNGQQVLGVPRSVWSTILNGKVYTFIGTESRLYALIGSDLTNITPLLTSSTAAADSLSTTYDTLGSNPIATTINSNIVTVTDSSAPRFRAGDTITLSGATATGGLGIGVLNTPHKLITVSAGSYTFRASATASSTATGGGASVIRKTGLIRCTVANTLTEGDRVKVSGAGDTGGILAAAINLEFITRNVTAAHFDFMTASTATSSVSAAGGGSTVFYPPIAAGYADESQGQGYGMGKYGVGAYGVAKLSSAARKYPRIWFFDRYGDYMMMTPGNGSNLYEWAGDINSAPVKTSGSPSAINYFFVSDNIIVTFGNGGTENRITASDQNGRTVWSGTAQNQFYDDNIEGAGRLISHIRVQGLNLIFTEKQVYTFRYIGLPNIWEVKLLSDVGIISAFAGREFGGIAYWMGIENWYLWAGGNVEVMPSNTQTMSTILNYVFKNLNYGQKSKIFAWYDKTYQEIKWHYPMANSNDPDAVANVNLLEGSWWPDTVSRVSAERPEPNSFYHRLASSAGILYNHEFGDDDDGQPLAWQLKTNTRTLGKNETLLEAFVPDSVQTAGSISVKVDAYQWPNSTTPQSSQTYTVNVGDGRQKFSQDGRFWQYTISGSVLGQSWRMGQWGEEKKTGGDGP